ncbi:SCP2 sterol-binding domain-containing protein [Aliiglaciecola sp. LCG003]|uniref:ubiquinone biosynthesis accessory factor UbiJ n=1 Tax=Aliiglaciecola sp. LCG003 TaxID=3053655 RepID=UPI0025726F63|nr:SCP2 sterol-binding domain-containing protein [Aliiglaciecola sp. LCG003]WJG09105.1 SCP2 sterol-binding domain-containing protein [Aliiglaciecola sp. LCG003]
MPSAQLASAAIELVLNRLLSLDPSSSTDLHKINGKQLQVTIRELPWPLIFHFSDRIDVLIAQTGLTNEVDCSLVLSLATLQKLSDSSQITQLIQSQELHLQGDINVAQGFSQVLTNLDIDWEEQLSVYCGDVLAHSVFSAGKSVIAKTNQAAKHLFKTLAEGAIEEKKLAPHPIQVAHYCNQVGVLRGDTDRLEAKIKLLEQEFAQK